MYIHLRMDFLGLVYPIFQSAHSLSYISTAYLQPNKSKCFPSFTSDYVMLIAVFK